MDNTTTARQTSRAPNGCNTALSVQLTADERRAIERIARTEQRSISSAGRMVLLDGLSARQQRLADQG